MRREKLGLVLTIGLLLLIYAFLFIVPELHSKIQKAANSHPQILILLVIQALLLLAAILLTQSRRLDKVIIIYMMEIACVLIGSYIAYLIYN